MRFIDSYKRRRIGAQHLQERRLLRELGERRGDRRIVAWPTRSTKNRYSQSPVRAGRDSKRDIDTPCVANGSSSACTAPGRFGADITSEVSSRPGRRRPAWRPSTQKRVVLLGSSSMCGASDGEPVDRRRDLAGDRRGAGLGGGEPRGLGVARHRDARHARQMLREPLHALRERLRVRIDARDVASSAPRVRQQVLVDAQLHLAADRKLGRGT